MLFTGFNFLRMGTTGFTAQAAGANNQVEIRATLLRALVIAVIAGVAAVLLQIPLKTAGLYFLGGSDAVQAATARYFDIRIYSAPFLLANYAILGWLVGLGRSGAGLALQLLLNGLNIALSIWFVLGLGWSVEGAALATVFSEIVAVIAGLCLVFSVAGRHGWPKARLVFDRRLLLRMLSVNRDIMLRSFALLFAFSYFAARSADQGDVVLAANAILQKFFIVGSYFLDGLATAAEQLAGRAVGARYRPAFDRMNRLTLFWTYTMAIILAGVFVVFGPAVIDLMTVSEDVREACRVYLIWAVLTPVAGALAFQMDGVFIGATWSRDMRNMMLVSLGVFLAAYQVLEPLMQNHGLWLALLMLFGIRGVLLRAICTRKAAQTFASA